MILLPACIAVAFSAVFGAGCNKKEYALYTNMPGGYKVLDDSFKTAELIEGYLPPEEVGAAPDCTGYTIDGRTYFFMMTEATVAAYSNFEADGEKDKFTAFLDEVKTTLSNIDKALSTTVNSSDVSRFNDAAAGEKVAISEIAYEVLSEAKAVYDWTEGYYNPALYYNILAYGFGKAHDYPETAADLPDDGIISKYTDLASHFGEVELSEENGSYFAVKPAYTVEAGGETLSLKLDLGGIGKGYAVDKVDGLFDKYGYKFGYFSFGSSSMLVKSHIDGAYNIYLTNPRSLSRDLYFQTTAINEKLSTSGDNEQFYNIDGTRYCHVIDPTTGKPVQTGIMSVTVIGGGAAEDDALTTAIMAMGKERAIKFIKEELPDRRVVFTCE